MKNLVGVLTWDMSGSYEFWDVRIVLKPVRIVMVLACWLLVIARVEE